MTAASRVQRTCQRTRARVLFAPIHPAAMKAKSVCQGEGGGGRGAEVRPEREKGLMKREGGLMHDETAVILLH